MASQPKPSALGHLRVLDLTGPLNQLCARIFADLGADVIKIEPPKGDPSRRMGPFLNGQPGPERSLTFVLNNRGKRRVVLDLESEDGRRHIQELARQVDVLVEDYKPVIWRRVA